MDMPRAGAAHERLARMSGHWTGTERLMPSPWSPEETQRSGVMKSHVLDDFFLITDYEQMNEDGEVSFRGHGVYSFDPQSEEYKMYWFDSMGGAGSVASGQFEGDRLTFENSSPMGQHRYAYVIGEGTLRFEMSMSPDGETWQTLMVGDYVPA